MKTRKLLNELLPDLLLMLISAACLLPLEDLRTAAAELSAMPDAPAKEKALAAARLLQDAADRRGVSLKLKKG